MAGKRQGAHLMPTCRSEYWRAYYERRRDHIKARNAAYHARNRGHINAQRVAYRAKHRVALKVSRVLGMPLAQAQHLLGAD